MACRTLFKCNL